MPHYEMSNEKYIKMLREKYPTKSALKAEIVRLNALLNLPKGTEHFLSDIHGEWEAFSHIRRNASGVIRNKLGELFGAELSEGELSELSTLVYYPQDKLAKMKERSEDLSEEYYVLINRFLKLARLVGSKYTREIVRDHLRRAAGDYLYIIEELLSEGEDEKKKLYCDSIIKTAIRIGAGEEVISALCETAKSLVIDHLHIVGDIFDRGPRADLVLDELMKERSIDIQWGNHDVLWMSAAAGSKLSIATVLNNSITYKNIDLIEIGYGISLRPLALFAEEVYRNSDISAFLAKGEYGGNFYGGADDLLVARMHKAISVIQFKLEGRVIRRNPDFLMEDRLLLDKMDLERRCVSIRGKEYPLRDCDFPTLSEDRYLLTEGEEAVMEYLKVAFMRSEKLTRQVKFLYDKGGMYRVYNNNLLYHGCIPMEEDGSFMALPAAGGRRGRELMDYCERRARDGFFAKEGSEERRRGEDFLWFLWCGKNSPLCARERIATFERLLVEDNGCWAEPKNAYYRSWDDEAIAIKILEEFGLMGIGSHIINGHIPVHRGESPMKANGRILVIDGGFCKAYHDSTGIGGYTLIYNADGMRLQAHHPFFDRSEAVKNNADILSQTVVFENKQDKMRIRETDRGAEIRETLSELMLLLEEYDNLK